MVGTIVISLDVELGWGHRGTRPEYINKIREKDHLIEDSFDKLVSIFEKHGIPATWGIVGALVNEGKDAIYHNPQILRTIQNSSVDHEIGLHSYNHDSFPGLSQEEAREDVNKGIEILSKHNVQPTSFIYPGNQIAHRKVLEEKGFQCYRSGIEQDFLHKVKSTVFPPTYSFESEGDGLIEIPGSLFIADPSKPNQLLYWQTKLTIERTIRTDDLTHFWLHPHNTIVDPSGLDHIDNIMSLLEEYESENRIRIVTMSTASRLMRN
jgi:peptidoglycan/xylan/chitin deacetylase (PgdA/CDA1 family)